MENNINDLIKNKLIKIDEVSFLDKLSENIKSTEDSLQELFLPFDIIEIKIDDLTLSVKKVKHGRIKRIRIFCDLIIDEKPISRALSELPIKQRLKAWEKVPLLLEEIYRNQEDLFKKYK